MNTFGRLFKVQIFGESHGDCVGVIIDGCPPGITLNAEMFMEDLHRRQGGQGVGTTPRKEDDIPIIHSGIFNEKTTGAPILIRFENKNIRSEDYTKQRSIPRPGHADWTAHIKYNGFEDYRGGGHFSARLTTGLVAAGVIAKQIIHSIHIHAHVSEVAGCTNIEVGLQKAIQAKDSVGGIIQCTVRNVPAGLGEPFFDNVESYLSHILFAIPAVKGIEFGAGFRAAHMFGSEHNDAIIDADGHTATNHAGGIVGGITNGNDLIFRLVVKPTSSTPKTQKSWNWDTNTIDEFSIKGRHDLCVALRAPVIVEAATAIALTDLYMIAQAFKNTMQKDN